MPVLLSLFVMLAAGGCSSGVPVRIQEEISAFDGAKETALAPMFVCSERDVHPCYIRLGLFRRSTMDPESVILVVVVGGTNPIAEGESLRFLINGESYTFVTIDARMQFGIGKGPHTTGSVSCGGSSLCSAKRYLIDRDFLKKLITCPEVSVVVDLARGAVGGQLQGDNPKMVLSGFREFYEKVFGRVE